MKTTKRSNLPQIPNKRYFTIGEVGYLCCVKPHVLRYWEQEFPQLKPSKRRGNRRYYQRDDVLMIRTIRGLLYDDGYTISGARIRLDGLLKEQRMHRNKQALDKIQYDKQAQQQHDKELEQAFVADSELVVRDEDYLLNVSQQEASVEPELSTRSNNNDVSYSVKFSFNDASSSQVRRDVTSKSQSLTHRANAEEKNQSIATTNSIAAPPPVQTDSQASVDHARLKAYKTALREVIAELEDIIAL